MFKEYDGKNYNLIFDKTCNQYKTPFHNDLFMMKIMIKCLEKTKYFIETGLSLGYTSYFVAKNFNTIKCYSCEIDANFYEKANNNIGILDNLKIDLCSSPNALYQLTKYYGDIIFNEYTLFWIDAHWGNSSNPDPLKDEINYITENFKKFTIFIDDFVIPYDSRFTNDNFTIENIIPHINNKENIKIYMPCYDSNHPDCNNINNCSQQPVGYCIITTENIDTFDYLKEII